MSDDVKRELECNNHTPILVLLYTICFYLVVIGVHIHGCYQSKQNETKFAYKEYGKRH